MKRSLVAGLVVVLGLSACATTDTASRNFSPDPGTRTVALPQGFIAREALNVQAITVRVPETLSVSEEDVFFPKADIVWREDPIGPRHEQVRLIVQAAADRAASLHQSANGRGVNVDIQITRFHALSERARYYASFGTTHEVDFFINLYDPVTGLAIELPGRTTPLHIKTTLNAYGGLQALQAVKRGETQKVRITEHLVKEIDQALTGFEVWEPNNQEQLSLR